VHQARLDEREAIEKAADLGGLTVGDLRGGVVVHAAGVAAAGHDVRRRAVRGPVGHNQVTPRRKSVPPGPLAAEAFQRAADGRTATSVAVWLTEQTGRKWRVKAVTDMIQRRTYLGERDGFTFTPLVPEALWDQANAALQARSSAHKGGRRTMHGYLTVCLRP
jgi:hypothetical protein